MRGKCCKKSLLREHQLKINTMSNTIIKNKTKSLYFFRPCDIKNVFSVQFVSGKTVHIITHLSINEQYMKIIITKAHNCKIP